MDKRQIIDYYDQTEIDYRLVWHLDSQMAMHYGFWDQITKNLSQALERENEVLAQIVRIKRSDLVLDAGCGVGGSAIFLAKKYGCRVVGITLSQKQVELAIKNSIKHKVDHLIEFRVIDFTKTGFKNNTFDVVWAIESVCHVSDKQKFIKESFRILKKGGRLILADFFANKENYHLREAKIMDNWLIGWSVQSLETMANFQKYLEEVGFKKVVSKIVTQKIIPSAKRLYIYSFPGQVLGWVLKLLGLRSRIQNSNIKAVYYQYLALKKHLWQYGIFYAQK